MFDQNKITGTLIILQNKKKVRYCEECEEEKDKFLAENSSNILSSNNITVSDHDEMFGKICNACYCGIGDYWYECKYCHCLENEEYSHMCDEMRDAYDAEPDLIDFDDDRQIYSWKNNPIPD